MEISEQAPKIAELLRAERVNVRENDSNVHVNMYWREGTEPSDHTIRELLKEFDGWNLTETPVPIVSRAGSKALGHRAVIKSITYYYEGVWNNGVFTRTG